MKPNTIACPTNILNRVMTYNEEGKYWECRKCGRRIKSLEQWAKEVTVALNKLRMKALSGISKGGAKFRPV